jgi:hypothetical protein
VQDRDDGRVQIVRLGRLGVEHLHAVHAAGHGEDGGAVKVAGEALGVERGGGDDQPQVLPVVRSLVGGGVQV